MSNTQQAQAIGSANAASYKREALATVKPDQARSRYYAQTLNLTDILREDQYTALARILNIIGGSGAKHPHDPDYIQISQSQWGEIFNHDHGSIAAVKARILYTLHSYRTGSYSKGYKLTLSMQARLDEAESGYKHESDGEERSTPKHEPRRGRNSHRLERIPNFIDVNTTAIISVLEAIASELNNIHVGAESDTVISHDVANLYTKHCNDRSKVTASLGNTRRELNDVLSLALHPDNKGMLPQVFRASPSSRWQGKDLNLQTTNKLTRMAALSGHYSYDISSAYHSIVSQLCSKGGLELPGLTFYVQNKQAVRAALATHSEASEHAVKAVLIALGYGAQENGDSMRAILTERQRQRLQSHPYYRSIASDLSSLTAYIADTADLTSNRSQFINVQGHRRDLHEGSNDQRRRISDTKITSHICSGYESQALMAMIEAADTPVLPVHDCLVCQRPEDPRKMEESIREATGLILNIDYERYPTFICTE